MIPNPLQETVSWKERWNPPTLGKKKGGATAQSSQDNWAPIGFHQCIEWDIPHFILNSRPL